MWKVTSARLSAPCRHWSAMDNPLARSLFLETFAKPPLTPRRIYDPQGEGWGEGEKGLIASYLGTIHARWDSGFRRNDEVMQSSLSRSYATTVEDLWNAVTAARRTTAFYTGESAGAG